MEAEMDEHDREHHQGLEKEGETSGQNIDQELLLNLTRGASDNAIMGGGLGALPLATFLMFTLAMIV